MFDRDIEAQEQLAHTLRTSDASALGNVEYVASGTYNDVFRVSAPQPVIMRISYYHDALFKKFRDVSAGRGSHEQMQNMHLIDPVTIKNNFGRVGNFMIEHRLSPHFAYFYGSRDAKNAIQRFRQVLTKERSDIMSTMNPLSLRYNNVSFVEHFETDLHELLKRHISDVDLKQIVFQVLYTLAVLQHHIPTFRHNDLSTRNVLIKKVPEDRRRSYVYDLNGEQYVLKDPAFFAAIYDFDLAHADAHVVHLGYERADFSLCNLAVDREYFPKEHINRSNNSSFDVHFFLHTLRRSMKKSSWSRDGKFMTEVNAWLRGLLFPDAYLTQSMARLTPANHLKHKYFNDLRVPREQKRPRGDFDFGIRPSPLEIYVGPDACRPRDPIAPEVVPKARDASVERPIVTVNGGNPLQVYSRVDNRFHNSLNVPSNATIDPTVFRFYDTEMERSMMKDVRAALIMKGRCPGKAVSVVGRTVFDTLDCEEMRRRAAEAYDGMELTEPIVGLRRNCMAFLQDPEDLRAAAEAMGISPRGPIRRVCRDLEEQLRAMLPQTT
jgi:hypothetical protein